MALSFYERHILPVMIARGMENKVMAEHRPRISPLAAGRVLEVGAGSGLNIPFYPQAIDHLFALDPLTPLLEKARSRAEAAPFPVDLMDASAEDIPLESASIDTVVSTWTMCSIPNLETALLEMRRVLKPGGRLLFIEHGRAPDDGVARWQDRLAPLFRGLAGCSLNRRIDEAVEAAGFSFTEIERSYLDGPRFLSYHFVGQARPA